MNPAARILLDLLRSPDPEVTLPDQLSRAAVSALPVDHVGISLMDAEGLALLVAGSDEEAVGLEDMQLTLGEGPCRSAFLEGRVITLSDVSVDGSHRWPVWTPAACDRGIAAAFAFPLRIGGIKLGTFDLYARRTGPLLAKDRAVALNFVDAAVLLVLQLHGARDLSSPFDAETLARSFRFEWAVHQATGMIAVQASVQLGEALVLLRAHAFAHDRPLNEVARDVVNRNLRFD